MTFNEAIADLYFCGFITAPKPYGPNVWAASHTGHGFQACARELARNLPGQCWPGKRSVSWVNGGGGPHGVLFDLDDLPKITDAQDTLADLGLDRNVWTLGRAARLMLGHVLGHAVRPHLGTSQEVLLDGIEVGYHDCLPGKYRHVTMYDVKSYYYTLMTRLPSLRVGVIEGKPEFYPMTDGETGRWNEILEVCEKQKVLRNSIFGAAMGSTKKTVVFSADKERPGHVRRVRLALPFGPFRGAGLLVVRSAWELCRMASEETQSVYSTVDSVTTRDQNGPQAWRRHGLDAEVKRSGAAHVCGLGAWRIGKGHRGTLPYQAGMIAPRPALRAPAPEREYTSAWL